MAGDAGCGGSPLELGTRPPQVLGDIQAEVVGLTGHQIHGAGACCVGTPKIIDTADGRVVDAQARTIVGVRIEGVGPCGRGFEARCVRHGERVSTDRRFVGAAALPIDIHRRSRADVFEGTAAGGVPAVVNADIKNMAASVNDQAAVDADLARTITVGVGRQHHIAAVGGEVLERGVAVDVAQSHQLDGRACLRAGDVALQVDVAAVDRDRPDRVQVGAQGHGFVFGGLADADAAVLGPKVPDTAEREVFDRGGAAGLPGHRARTVGLDGTRCAGVAGVVPDRVGLEGELSAVAGGVVGGTKADAADGRPRRETHGVVRCGCAARGLEALHVDVPSGRHHRDAATAGVHLKLQARGVVLQNVAVAFESDVAGVGLDQLLIVTIRQHDRSVGPAIGAGSTCLATVDQHRAGVVDDGHVVAISHAAGLVAIAVDNARCRAHPDARACELVGGVVAVDADSAAVAAEQDFIAQVNTKGR